MLPFTAALLADDDISAPTAIEPAPSAHLTPRGGVTSVILMVGASAMWLALRLLMFGATAWAGLYILREALSLIGLKHLPAVTQPQA
jgi:hypothetical protein